MTKRPAGLSQSRKAFFNGGVILRINSQQSGLQVCDLAKQWIIALIGSDGVITLKEYLNRARGTWFVVFDADENDLLSYDEYASGNPGLVRAGRCEAVFAAIDRDSDGRLTLDEHLNKPREAYFVHMDRDGDERVTFKEFTVWKNTPQQIEDAKKDFENRDTDQDGLLTLEEFTGGAQ